MATANKKRSAAAADKAPETAQPDHAQQEAVKAERKFDSADELAHFIHHNPEFGALPLQEQDTLRGQLVTAKRAEAEQDGYWPDGRKRLTLTEGDALADLNGTPRPDNHVD